MDAVVAAVLGTLVLLGLSASAAAVLLAVLMVRVARRARARVGTTAERVRLGAHAAAGGPRGEVARLRLELRGSTESVRRVLAVAGASRWPVGDAPLLLLRLERAAASVDAELVAVGHERDERRAAALLPALRARVATLATSAGSLRQGLVESSLRLGADELSALQADCAVEARALRARAYAPTIT